MSDCLRFMVRAGQWVTEFVSKEARVPIDSSEHESSASGRQGLSQVSLPNTIISLYKRIVFEANPLGVNCC